MLKATAFEPERRYASAVELAADVGRFLDGRPVSARNPSWMYLGSRFVRRNRALSLAVAALVVAILGGVAAALWQAHRAEQQRAIAERRFDEARRLVYTVIREIQPKMAEINGTVALRVELIEKTLTYLEALQVDAGDNPALMRELLDSYVQLAEVSGNVGQANVGNRRRMTEALGKASELADQLERRFPSSDPVRLWQIAVLHLFIEIRRDDSCGATAMWGTRFWVSARRGGSVRPVRLAGAPESRAARVDAAQSSVALADVVQGKRT